MSSAAQRKASKINGARSRGPVTEEGKERSKMNGLKHGLGAKTLILPGENAAEFDVELEQAIDDYQPRDWTESRLVHHIVSADWFHLRVQRAQFERLKRSIDGADDREENEVTATLDRLFANASGPLGTYALSGAYCGGPRTSFPEKVDDSEKP